MSVYKCPVCGYEEAGDHPPEQCPVCGQAGDQFEQKTPSADAPVEAPADDRQRHWECTVCGYIHVGPEPPETCPICGADRSEFIEIFPDQPDDDAVADTAPDPDAQSPEDPVFSTAPAGGSGIDEPVEENSAGGTMGGRFTKQALLDLMVTYHAHPISVHIPNGVAPVSVLFVLLAALFGNSVLDAAAFANMIVVMVSMPLVIYSGYNDWQRRFGGRITTVFTTKIVCAGIVTLASFLIVVWRLFDPGIVVGSGAGTKLYLMLHLVLLAAAVTAGYMGGKLVFPKRK